MNGRLIRVEKRLGKVGPLQHSVGKGQHKRLAFVF